MVYEDIHAWREAWRLLENLRETTTSEFEMNWFSFEEIPLFLNRASRLGATADLTVITTSQKDVVPEPVHWWLRAIRTPRPASDGALIGLILDADHRRKVCPWEGLIAETAHESGRNLFLRSTEQPGRQPGSAPPQDLFAD